MNLILFMVFNSFNFVSAKLNIKTETSSYEINNQASEPEQQQQQQQQQWQQQVQQLQHPQLPTQPHSVSLSGKI